MITETELVEAGIRTESYRQFGDFRGFEVIVNKEYLKKLSTYLVESDSVITVVITVFRYKLLANRYKVKVVLCGGEVNF